MYNRKVTNYLIALPIHQSKSEETGDTENVITKYCMPEHIIMDQDSVFMSSIMTHLVKDCPKDLSKVTRKTRLNVKDGMMKKGGQTPKKPIVTQLAFPDEAPRT